MEINNLLYAGFIFLIIVVASFIGATFALNFSGSNSTTVVGPGTELKADPITIQLLKAWNYTNLESSEAWLGGCRVERLGADEWKINFKECE